jgi:hypothetical protein
MATPVVEQSAVDLRPGERKSGNGSREERKPRHCGEIVRPEQKELVLEIEGGDCLRLMYGQKRG